MKHRLVIVIGLTALILGYMWASRGNRWYQHAVLDTERFQNVVVQLNGNSEPNPSFSANDEVRITGDMDVLERPEDVTHVFVAFLVMPDHPKGDVIANTAPLNGTQTGATIHFDGVLQMPPFGGRFELRLFVMDAKEVVQTMAVDRLFHRQPITVTKK